MGDGDPVGVGEGDTDGDGEGEGVGVPCTRSATVNTAGRASLPSDRLPPMVTVYLLGGRGSPCWSVPSQ